MIIENKQLTKGEGKKDETKWTGQLKKKEMKRKNEEDHSGPGFVTPPKYLKKVLPWGTQYRRRLQDMFVSRCNILFFHSLIREGPQRLGFPKQLIYEHNGS